MEFTTYKFGRLRQRAC